MSAEPKLAAPSIALEVDPARVAVKLTIGFAVGTTLASVWRVATVSGNQAFVRGWQENATGVATAILFDYEVPLGVEVVYHAEAWDSGGVSSPVAASAPITVDDERDWLVDLARPTNTFPILVESLPALAFAGPVGVHHVLERRDPILTTAPAWTPTGALTFTTVDELERDRARTILGGGGAVLLKSPPERGVGNLYFGVTNLVEQRVSRLGQHADRRFAAELVQIARPDPALYVPAPPLTYRERLAEWPTYQDVVDTGSTYQELAYTFPADRIDPIIPWLPDDV